MDSSKKREPWVIYQNWLSFVCYYTYHIAQSIIIAWSLTCQKVQVKLTNQDYSIKKCSYSNCNMLKLYSDSCGSFQNTESSEAAGLLHRFQLSKYEALNQLKQKVDTKATRETGLSWWQLQEKRSPENLAVTMAAHFMYIVLHASVTGFIRRGCHIIPAGLHGSCYIWLKVNIKSSLNVITKLETDY